MIDLVLPLAAMDSKKPRIDSRRLNPHPEFHHLLTVLGFGIIHRFFLAFSGSIWPSFLYISVQYPFPTCLQPTPWKIGKNSSGNCVRSRSWQRWLATPRYSSMPFATSRLLLNKVQRCWFQARPERARNSSPVPSITWDLARRGRSWLSIVAQFPTRYSRRNCLDMSEAPLLTLIRAVWACLRKRKREQFSSMKLTLSVQEHKSHCSACCRTGVSVRSAERESKL